MEWNKENTDILIQMKKNGASYKKISQKLGCTVSAAKHKYVRIKQSENDDRHHHPKEKIQQIGMVLDGKTGLKILETNCGWGNLTKIYSEVGTVKAADIVQEKVDYVNQIENVTALKIDSHKLVRQLVGREEKFDVVDVDPYGFPSRYFPYVMELIDNGYLFLTFPKMGVQQINKIMVEHYRVFWGMSLDDKRNQIEIIEKKVSDYGFQTMKAVSMIDCIEIGSVYRMAFVVEKKSLLDIVGLKVNRANKIELDGQMDMFKLMEG